MSRRAYSEDEKAAALLALDSNGGNLYKTAKETHIPLTTLERWKKGQGISADVTDVRNRKKGNLASRYEALVSEMLDHAATTYKDASFGELVRGIGIFQDKALLLRGQATAVHAFDFTDDQMAILMAEHKRLLEEDAQKRIEAPTFDVEPE